MSVGLFTAGLSAQESSRLAMASSTRPNVPGLPAGAGLGAPASADPVGTRPVTVETRGDILMARKMYRDAIDMYRTVSPQNAIITNKIGIAFHQLLQFDQAKKNYDRAIKLNPKYAEAINNLGSIYYSRKSYRRAVNYYKRALRYAPASATMHVNLGSAYLARHQFEKASEAYEEALKLDADVFEHRGHYGTLLQERNFEERAKFHLYLAKTYAKAGANERALIYLRKALEEGIKDAERQKIPEMPEFAGLKADAAFSSLMASAPKPL